MIFPANCQNLKPELISHIPAVYLLINMWLVLGLTFMLTLAVRTTILPVYDTIELPLNFVFSTCEVSSFDLLAGRRFLQLTYGFLTEVS